MQTRKANIDDTKAVVKKWADFFNEHDDIVSRRNLQLKQMNIRNDNACSMYEKFISPLSTS